MVVFGYVTDAVDETLVGGDRMVRAGKGDDLISSSTFEDNRIFGQQGNDVISVSGANNFVKGDRGQDQIIMDVHINTATGGRGADQFVFTFTNDAERIKTITDFQAGVDELAISNDFYNRFDVSNTIYGNVDDPVIGAGDMIVTMDNYGTVIFQNLTIEDQVAVAQYVGSEIDFIGT